MRTRGKASPRTHGPFTSATIVLVVMLAAIPIAGQEPAPREDSSLRTPFGHPDLQGVWTFQTLTPLQRPEELTGRTTLTEEEVERVEREAAARQSKELTLGESLEAGRVGNYGTVFKELPTTMAGTRQTSLVIDPPNGRLPPLTPAGAKLRADLAAAKTTAAGPEDRSVPERCLLGIFSGPPMLPGGLYNNNFELFQTPDHVVIHMEMVHDPRIIPLDGRPHPSFRQWRGTSRGRWEGDTLVVETRNFIGRRDFLWPHDRDENLEVVERFTRIDAGTIRYVATVNDPTVWTTPWTVSYEMRKQEGLEGQLYEYACHEGNAGAGGVPSIMMSMLGAAREREKAGAEVPATKP